MAKRRCRVVRPVLGLLVLWGWSGAAWAGAARVDVVLPAPDATLAQDAGICAAVGCTVDRRQVSHVPGPAVNDELVLVGLAGDGGIVEVRLEQRLLLTGQGDYQVRERGPARSAVTLGDADPPVTKLGTVVWQGFTPGDRRLAARLTLDAALERPHLPLAVTLSFTDRHGRTGPVPSGGHLRSAGTVEVRLANRTAQPAALPVPVDAPAAAVAPLLDRLRRAATGTGRVPAAGAGLPTRIPGTGGGTAAGTRSVPLRVAGRIAVTGAGSVLSGPGSAGNTVRGVLAGDQSVDLRLDVAGPGALELDLTAVPALDPRALAPPDGFPTWSAWAARHPSAAARRDALGVLIDAAAAGARAASFSPYLGAGLPGTGSTAFHYALSAAPAQLASRTALVPRAGPLAVAGLAVLLLLTNAALLWRRL